MKNADKYTTLKKQSLNLGIYGADLNYANVFEKSMEVQLFMESCRALVKKLDIESASRHRRPGMPGPPRPHRVDSQGENDQQRTGHVPSAFSPSELQALSVQAMPEKRSRSDERQRSERIRQWIDTGKEGQVIGEGDPQPENCEER
jgi:hypothetical protein